MFFKPIDKGKGNGGGDDTSCYLPANKIQKSHQTIALMLKLW